MLEFPSCHCANFQPKYVKDQKDKAQQSNLLMQDIRINHLLNIIFSFIVNLHTPNSQ